MSDRPIRDCEHPKARHQHGTPQAYVLDKCRCTPCTDANTQRENERDAAKAAGTYDTGRVDAEPVRGHILKLKKAGYGLKTIARLAKVSNSTLGKIIYGDPSRNMPPRARVEKHVAARVLAINPSLTTLGETVKINAAPTQARIRHLVCLGYSIGWQAKRMGKEHGNFALIMNKTQCNAKTAREIRTLYLLLWDKPRVARNRHEQAAITRALAYAAAHGWEALPPPTEIPSAEAPVNPDRALTQFLTDRIHRQARRKTA